MLIEIKGVQFVNKGAELMLMAMVEKITELWPEADICLSPRLNSPYTSRAKLGAYQKLNLRKGQFDLNSLSYWLPSKIRNYLKRAWGIVTEADVDIVLDASGFSYGDQWPDLALIQAAKECKHLAKHKKHYIFMPQALGPFTQKVNKKWAQVAFDHASLVFARDEVSYQATKLITEQSNVFIAPDFTNLITPSVDKEYTSLSGGVAIIPNSKMLSAQNKNHLWRKRYVQALVELIETLKTQGESVFLLNHEGRSDDTICQLINQQLEQPIVIVTPKSALQVKAIIGRCKLTICSRFHGCVSSLSQGVPCIATSWSHKYEQLFVEYDQQNFLLSPELTATELERFITSTLNNVLEIQQLLVAKGELYKQQSKQMWLTIQDRIG